MAINEVVVNGVTELSLVNDTVSEETLLDGTTAHDASGNLIVGKAKYINPCLLINPDFSINQRGQAEYTEGGYIVDSWRISSDTIYNTESKTMSAKSSDGLEYYIEQIIENAVDLYGKEITFSAEVLSTGTCVVKIYAFNGIEYTFAESDVIVEGIASCTMKVPEDATLLFVRVLGLGNYETTIKNVKLELGSVATPFVPPNPAVELVKCQRYFYRVGLGTGNVHHGVGISSSTGRCLVTMPTPVTMRINPTVTITGNVYLANSKATNVPVKGIAASFKTGANASDMQLYVDTESGALVVGDAYLLRTESSFIDFSAEL